MKELFNHVFGITRKSTVLGKMKSLFHNQKPGSQEERCLCTRGKAHLKKCTRWIALFFISTFTFELYLPLTCLSYILLLVTRLAEDRMFLPRSWLLALVANVLYIVLFDDQAGCWLLQDGFYHWGYIQSCSSCMALTEASTLKSTSADFVSTIHEAGSTILCGSIPTTISLVHILLEIGIQVTRCEFWLRWTQFIHDGCCKWRNWTVCLQMGSNFLVPILTCMSYHLLGCFFTVTGVKAPTLSWFSSNQRMACWLEILAPATAVFIQLVEELQRSLMVACCLEFFAGSMNIAGNTWDHKFLFATGTLRSFQASDVLDRFQHSHGLFAEGPNVKAEVSHKFRKLQTQTFNQDLRFS